MADHARPEHVGKPLNWRVCLASYAADAQINRYFYHQRKRARKVADNGSLSLSEVRPATAIHPKTGEEVWFIQADGFHPSILGDEEYRAVLSANDTGTLRLNAYFGDGGELELSDLEHIREVIRNEMVLVAWRPGDILVLDNLLACHGRMPFTGPRKVLLAMA